jgi:predicted signal transduction protein with EAL and GGDEF domain
MGGDEFMFILEKITSPNDASAVAQKLLETVALPLRLEGHDIFMTASIGIAIYPSDGQDRDGLIQYADTAMYATKAKSNSFQFYSADMNVRAADRLQLETDLRRAVEREEFLPHYQPLIDAHSGNICGVEALVRWKHPHRGLLSPDSFVSVAEETGLIVPITELMLRAACAQTKAWQVGGFPHLRVAANISRRLFQYHNLSDMIVQILHETGLEPSSLEVELTESLFIQDRERSIATLRKLRNVGVRIAIDDFGVEYSSLGYLKHLPITTLKIDQSFVRDLPTNPVDTAIIQAIISLAKCLDLTVIAEGVETNAQADFLRSRLCDEFQGYYFSHPLPANLLTPLLGHSVFRPARSRITLGSPEGR